MNNRLSLLLLMVNISVLVSYSQVNNVVVWGSGGYSSFIKDANNLTSVGNIGTEIGIGYELAIDKFIIQTGVGYQYLNASLQMPDSLHSLMMMDSEQDIYRGYFLFAKNNDLYQMGNLTIPLLLGLKFDKFYFLAGMKMAMNMSAKSTHQSTITSTADYIQFIDIFENMPNHGYHTYKEKHSFPIKFSPSYAASVEFGYLHKPKNKSLISYRIAAFANYGINNINTENAKSKDLILNANNETYFPYLNSLLLLQDYKNQTFSPLFTGVKLSVVFGIRKHVCIVCDYF